MNADVTRTISDSSRVKRAEWYEDLEQTNHPKGTGEPNVNYTRDLADPNLSKGLNGDRNDLSRLPRDHAGGRACFELMLPYFGTKFGNAASGSHSFGWEAEGAVEVARRKRVADLAGAPAREIVVFTSGATESDNLALKGAVEAAGGHGHVVTVATRAQGRTGHRQSAWRSAAARSPC